jgi:phytoene synthase
MKQRFDQLAFEISKKTTSKYSTSFSLGIWALQPRLRPAIYAIYGYVRLADEIVDSFDGFDQKTLLNRLKKETDLALSEGIALNPLLQSFQETVRHYQIDRTLIDQFMHSMEMDLHPLNYDTPLYQEYIHGSAEVVGLICLNIFMDGNKEKYEELKPYAMKLGSAFQKVNFLRDLKDDYHLLGRTYFPHTDLTHFDHQTKSQIEKEIEMEFKEALIGIKKLPASARFGVYLAYKYYLSLFKKITSKSPTEILNKRIRVSNQEKAYVALKSYVRYKIAFW